MLNVRVINLPCRAQSFLSLAHLSMEEESASMLDLRAKERKEDRLL
jgi:hypothetical protein